MGTIVFLLMIGIPCAAVLIWWRTPKGRRWLRQNNLLGIMDTLIILAYIGIPCLAALMWFLTPKGRHWLERNNLL